MSEFIPNKLVIMNALAEIEAELYACDDRGEPTRLHEVIARVNALLPAEDPRKITREHVALLRAAVDALQHVDAFRTELHDLAEAIESYVGVETSDLTNSASQR